MSKGRFSHTCEANDNAIRQFTRLSHEIKLFLDVTPFGSVVLDLESEPVFKGG